MVSQGRKRDLARRPPTRKRKLRILAVCEGVVTELQYLRKLQHHFRNSLVHVEAKGQGVPLTVVQIAVAERNRAEQKAKNEEDVNERWDSVWAVVDVDEHPNIPEARALATKEGVHVAISNPSFELWALLHFEDQTAHIERDQVRQRLKKHFPDYEKELPFEKVHPGYADAVRRAARLLVDAEDESAVPPNPSTGVHRLTELIRVGHP